MTFRWVGYIGCILLMSARDGEGRGRCFTYRLKRNVEVCGDLLFANVLLQFTRPCSTVHAFMFLLVHSVV